jgi:hypothetical protein
VKRRSTGWDAYPQTEYWPGANACQRRSRAAHRSARRSRSTVCTVPPEHDAVPRPDIVDLAAEHFDLVWANRTVVAGVRLGRWDVAETGIVFLDGPSGTDDPATPDAIEFYSFEDSVTSMRATWATWSLMPLRRTLVNPLAFHAHRVFARPKTGNGVRDLIGALGRDAETGADVRHCDDGLGHDCAGRISGFTRNGRLPLRESAIKGQTSKLRQEESENMAVSWHG